jgi:hypothetical protein
MMALASREHLSALDDFHHLWREERLGMICDSDDDELHIL